MRNSFIINDGTITIADGVIRISDNKNPVLKAAVIAGASILALTGGLFILVFIRDTVKENTMAFAGMMLILAGLMIIIRRIRMSWQNVLEINKVRKVLVKQYGFGYLKADFCLDSGLIRRVILDINDVLGFRPNALEDFRRTLNSMSIPVELHQDIIPRQF